MEPLPGDRVVVRYRLGVDAPDDWRGDGAANPAFGHTPLLSDISGTLVAADDNAVVVERDQEPARIPASAVSSLRLLSAQVVRNSEIRTVHGRLSAADGTADTAMIDGWLVSATHPAVPLEYGASAAAAGRLRAWYAARGLPARVVAPERFGRAPDGEPGPAREVLVNDDGDAVEVLGTDRPERLRLRGQGYRHHHVFRLVSL